jgi:hypothetical protein
VNKDLPNPRCVINVQPYFHPAVALVQYPKKIVLNLISGSIGYLDLESHPTGEPERYELLHASLENAGGYLTACVDDLLDEAIAETQ